MERRSIHIRKATGTAARWTVCEPHMATSSAVVVIHEGGPALIGYDQTTLFSDDPAFWLALSEAAHRAAILLAPLQDPNPLGTCKWDGGHPGVSGEHTKRIGCVDWEPLPRKS